jgi:hypothetical protein
VTLFQIPDETFFGYGEILFLFLFLLISAVIANTYEFVQSTIQSTKRYFKFNTSHPKDLDMSFVSEIGVDEVGNDPKYLFIRKVNFQKNLDFLDWVFEKHIDKHIQSDDVYGVLEGLEFIPGEEAWSRLKMSI